MKSELEYDSSRPLMRLEKGDKVFIKYREAIYENEKDRSVYKNVPDGYYNGTYMGNYTVKCSEYPELSGKYNYWRGDRWCSSSFLFADESLSSNKN
ncbi:hypothetical protein BH739_04000 [Enterococcus casseliflavus]|nr:hypothetical protein BH739_04000 [Enterococcus casseliflavus]